MTEITVERDAYGPLSGRSKFQDPNLTARGEARASVPFERLETLWINTGTLCNIQCVNCYIESSPSNDRLAYITAAEAAGFFDEIERRGLGTREIGFTGGEPFMNPDIMTMTEDALARGFAVLILTNAMQPMQRPRVKAGLERLRDRFGDRLTIRVSLDHFTQRLHETERGPRSWDKTLEGLDWLSERGFRVAIAGRTCWNEDETTERRGYAELIAAYGWRVDPQNPSELVLLPEMEAFEDVPEITTRCWDLLGLHPSEVMCATSRMVVKRKGAARPTVLPCTLLPYDLLFEMGASLDEAERADGGMFDRGAVKLCHPYCAKFCVLGGANCAG